MTPDLFTARNVIVQGITGAQGSFHTRNMLATGTQIVAGTSPNKAGETVEGVPVFASIAEIQRTRAVEISIIFVPAAYAKEAIFEAIEARVPLIICITEGIPVHDMIAVKQKLKNSKSILVGPNSPGILIPGVQSLGIIPSAFASPGDTAIISRSGTLTYEAMDSLSRRWFGQKYIVGIGGDMIHGTEFVDWLRLFEDDRDISRILLIGEIGGVDEIVAADFINQHVNKPTYAYIAGHSAPSGIQMGHAGAIFGTNHLESASEKTEYMAGKGIVVANSLPELIEKVA